MKNAKEITAGILWIVFYLLNIVGWVINLFLLIQSNDSVGMLIVRGIGVIFTPLGSILGLYSFLLYLFPF